MNKRIMAMTVTALMLVSMLPLLSVPERAVPGVPATSDYFPSVLPEDLPEIAVLHYGPTTSVETHIRSMLWPQFVTYVNISTVLGDYTLVRGYDVVVLSVTVISQMGASHYRNLLYSIENTTKDKVLLMHGTTTWRYTFTADDYTDDFKISCDPDYSHWNTTVCSDVFGDLTSFNATVNPPSSLYANMSHTLSGYDMYPFGTCWGGTAPQEYAAIGMLAQRILDNGTVIELWTGGDNYWAEIMDWVLFDRLDLLPSRFPGVACEVGDPPESQAEIDGLMDWLETYPWIRTSTHLTLDWPDSYALYSQVLDAYGEGRYLTMAHGTTSHEAVTGYSESEVVAWFDAVIASAQAKGLQGAQYFFVTPGDSDNAYFNETAKEKGYLFRSKNDKQDWYDSTTGYYINSWMDDVTGWTEDYDAKANAWNSALSVLFSMNVLAGQTYSGDPPTRFSNFHFVGHHPDFAIDIRMANKTGWYVHWYEIGLPSVTVMAFLNCVVHTTDFQSGHDLTYTNYGTYATVSAEGEIYIKLKGRLYANSNVWYSDNGKYTWVYLPADTEVRVATSLSGLGGWPCIDDFYGKVKPVSLSADGLTATYSVNASLWSQMKLYTEGTEDTWTVSMNGASFSPDTKRGWNYLSFQITGMDGTAQTMTLTKGESNENFTYRTQYGEFRTLITEPETTQATIGEFETAWGQIGFQDQYYFFQDIEINGTGVAEAYLWDPWIEYYFLNDTGTASRKFANYWIDCDWSILLNDSQFMVVQKSAECPHIWSGSTMEWNLTIRICVNKIEPVLMFDYWLKNLNESSYIKAFTFAGLPYMDANLDNETRLSDRNMVHQEGPGYAYAEVGPFACNWGGYSSGTNWNEMIYKGFRNGARGEYLHGANIWTIGESVSEVIALADKVGSAWNRHVDGPEVMNLLVANNSERYDAWTYVDGQEFSYLPSETSETVYANGDWYNATFSENPIDNYARYKTITQVDDYGPDYPGEGDLDWVASKVREYDYPVALFTNLGWLGAYAKIRTDELANMSLERAGTLFEVADHSWNHTSWTTYWQYEYAMTVFNLTYNYWYNSTGDYAETMYSHGTAGTTWGNETLWALADFGFKTLRIRLYHQDSEMLWLYNGTLLMMNLNSYVDPDPDNLTDWINRSRAVGYHLTVWHVATEMNDAAEKTQWETYLSAVENQSVLMPVSTLQYYDLYRGTLNYSTINGMGHIDLSDCSDGHKVFLKPNAYGRFPVFRDDSTGEIATMGTNGEYAWLYAERGHTYTEVMSYDATARAELEVYSYNPAVMVENQVVAAWKVRATSGTVYFTIPGLYPTKKYMAKIDGGVGSQYVSDAAGNINLSYSGPWSEHTFSLYVYFDGGAEGDELIADFIYEIAGSRVKFYDESSGYNIVGWAWDFGDGSASTAQDPTHTYHEAGSYYVRFTVVNAEGETDTTTKLITVGELDQPFGLDLTQLVIVFGFIVAGFVAILVSRRASGAVVGIVCIAIAIWVLLGG